MITTPSFWAILGGAAIVYWVLPRHRDWTLVATTAAWLALVDWRSLVAVGALSLVAFAVGRRAPTLPRGAVALAVVGTLGYLAWYKYLPPLRVALGGAPAHPRHAAHDGAIGLSAALPLGASYFTFKLVHYLADARRGQQPRHDLSAFLGYMFFLPMFPAGPIERFDEYLAHRASAVSKEQITEGLWRVTVGVIKKLVLVDLLLVHEHTARDPSHLLRTIPFVFPPLRVDQLLRESATLSPLFTWQFVVHQFTAWYLDFSAYSDIAIGAALFFGVRLTENFDWPLLAPNPTAFWKRYHMSLSAFCQRYVYLPVMARSRSPYVAVYATMIAMGLWHAGSLNYLAWGAYHATVLSLYLTWGRVKRALRWKPKGPALTVLGTVATALVACASAVFPATGDRGLRAAFTLLGNLVGLHG